MLYQQGDVLIIKKNINIINATKLNHVVLAEGEATGHCHMADPENAELLKLGEQIILNVFGKSATITHQEHNKIEVPNGIYFIDLVKEYDHFLEESRKVID